MKKEKKKINRTCKQEFYAEHAARDQDDTTTKDMPAEDWVSH